MDNYGPIQWETSKNLVTIAVVNFMEEKWSPKIKNCKNCLTKRFPHKAKGYCSRCYPLVGKLCEVGKWDLGKLGTLRSYPKDLILHNPDTFEKIKKGSLKQYQERLDSLKHIEESLNKPISGIELEYKIRDVADLAGEHGSNLFFGSANLFDHNFNKKQKKILYKLFNTITENVKWGGINLYRISE